MSTQHPPPPGSDRLRQRIRAEIAAHGPIPFARFMERALYEPGLGYYTGPRTKIGKEGDFYTSLDVHPVFGRLIGAQVVEMSRALPEGPFTVVEMGAGKGLLAFDILRAVRDTAPALFARLRYAIVDISPDLMARQQRLLAEFSGCITWHSGLEELAPVRGVLLSNELVDSLPHHQVVMTAGGLREVFVAVAGERFVERLAPPSSPELAQTFEKRNLTLPEGYRTEINLAARRWMRLAAERLDAGYVLTIDYGYPATTLYRSDRRTGSFLCYHRHMVSEDPYARVGEQDMTAHVDFSALADAGMAAGLTLDGFTDQAHFLVGLGISTWMQQVLDRDGGDPENSDEFRSMRRLMDPLGMGKAFKVLVQRRGVPPQPLSGLQFRAFDVSDLTLPESPPESPP
ncbi:MAG: SAM-dependent methyltransferase [Nitrospirota bacterium]|nr:SAM-dependent methyltransferase [Nitrospirota bacterium]